MSDICEREDHSIRSMNFGASGIDCPYCRIAELEARLVMAEGYMSKAALRRFRKALEGDDVSATD